MIFAYHCLGGHAPGVRAVLGLSYIGGARFRKIRRTTMKHWHNKVRIAVVAALFAVCVTSGATAILISNGSFETGDFTGCGRESLNLRGLVIAVHGQDFFKPVDG